MLLSFLPFPISALQGFTSGCIRFLLLELNRIEQNIMAAPHFIFYYRFCNSLDFYCALHPKKLFLSFSRTFCDYRGDCFKIQGQFKDKLHFFRIPGVFQDQGHFQGVVKVCANPVLHVISNRVFYSLSLYFSLSLELLFCNAGVYANA